LIILLLAVPQVGLAGGEGVLVLLENGAGFGLAQAGGMVAGQGSGAFGMIDDSPVSIPVREGPTRPRAWVPTVETPVTEDLLTFLNQLQPGQILLASWGAPRIYGYFSHSLLVLEGGLLLDVRNNPVWGQGVILLKPAEILERIKVSYGRLTALEVASADPELRTRVARTAPDSLGLPFNILVPRRADWAHYCSQFIWLRYFLASQGEIDLAPQETYYVTPDQIYVNPATVQVGTWLRPPDGAD
jgi:hypothetical protein